MNTGNKRSGVDWPWLPLAPDTATDDDFLLIPISFSASSHHSDFVSRPCDFTDASNELFPLLTEDKLQIQSSHRLSFRALLSPCICLDMCMFVSVYVLFHCLMSSFHYVWLVCHSDGYRTVRSHLKSFSRSTLRQCHTQNLNPILAGEVLKICHPWQQPYISRASLCYVLSRVWLLFFIWFIHFYLFSRKPQNV